MLEAEAENALLQDLGYLKSLTDPSEYSIPAGRGFPRVRLIALSSCRLGEMYVSAFQLSERNGLEALFSSVGS